nr:unnamed protein product [Callosobruchus analis]
MATKLPKWLPHLQKFTWKYTESGHGKGAPDDIGATCKRTADSIVAAGGDIENLEKFVEATERRCPAISLSIVQDDDIEQMSAEVEREVTKFKTFVGTLKVHQITGEFYDYLGLTFLRTPSSPGDNVMQAAIVPTNNINAYMILVEVEFLHDGHAEQHKEQAALPQQHASYNKNIKY